MKCDGSMKDTAQALAMSLSSPLRRKHCVASKGYCLREYLAYIPAAELRNSIPYRNP